MIGLIPLPRRILLYNYLLSFHVPLSTQPCLIKKCISQKMRIWNCLARIALRKSNKANELTHISFGIE